jgi:hypothetical protein
MNSFEAHVWATPCIIEKPILHERLNRTTHVLQNEHDSFSGDGLFSDLVRREVFSIPLQDGEQHTLRWRPP